MEKTVLRVGILGFGMIGNVHAFAHAAMPYYAPGLPIRCQITHVVTAHEETTRAAKEKVGCSHWTTDFREVTENPQIDLVHICTPNDQHCSALLSAIEQQKFLYCDKPLTVTLDEAQLVRDQLLRCDTLGKRRYTRTNQMTFHLRFFAAIKRAKQLIDEGRLGRIFQYRIGYFHASNASASAPLVWKRGEAGGVIRDIASHAIDLIDFLIGLPAEGIAHSMIAHPVRTTLLGERDAVVAEDSVSLLTRGPHRSKTGTVTADSVSGVIEATKLATGYEDELKWEIHGEKGALRFSLMSPHYLEFFDATAKDRPYGGLAGWLQIPAGGRYEFPDADFPSPKATSGWNRAHIACLSHFLQHVASGTASEPDLLQGYRIQKVLDAVFCSCRSGQWERWIE